MNVEDLMKSVNESYEKNANVKLVFGEAITKEGITVIPVAKISAKVGEGTSLHINIGSPVNNAKEQKEEGIEQAQKKIEKAGYGIQAKLSPVGYIEIKNGKAEYKPIIDVTRIATMGICYAAFFVFTMSRMITKIAKFQLHKKCNCDCKKEKSEGKSDCCK